MLELVAFAPERACASGLLFPIEIYKFMSVIMPANIRTIWEGLQDAFDSMAVLVVVNVLWVLLTIPVLTAPASLAGAYYMTNLMAHRKPVSWRTFFEGFRQFFWLSWGWTLSNILVALVLYSNFVFYARFSGRWVAYVQGIALGAGVLWLVLQVYVFPLLIEQEDRRLRIALRNSFILLVSSPGLASILIVILIIVVGLSLLLQVPLLIITASLSTFLANWCAIHALQAFTAQQDGLHQE